MSILPNVSKIFERCLYDQKATYFEHIFSRYQCGFCKGNSAQQCFLAMTEKWKKIVGDGGVFRVLLTDLSKAFHCILHDLIISKLEVYGFDIEALKPIHDYLANRKQSFKLKLVSATFLLVCFLSLKESTCQTRKNVFYFTSKAPFVVGKIKF